MSSVARDLEAKRGEGTQAMEFSVKKFDLLRELELTQGVVERKTSAIARFCAGTMKSTAADGENAVDAGEVEELVEQLDHKSKAWLRLSGMKRREARCSGNLNT